MTRDPVLGEYVIFKGFCDVVLRVKERRFNGGSPICVLVLVGARSEQALGHWRRANGFAPNTKRYEAYVHELAPANEMLVVALEARDD